MQPTILQELIALGAGETAHITDSLLAHLHGTEAMLRAWGSRPALCDAGLCHALYGTSGFEQVLIDPAERRRAASLIGAEAEAIVYLYGACDRNHFYRQILTSPSPEYRDRFTEERFVLPLAALRDFCELTMANELDIAAGSAAFAAEYGDRLRRLFAGMRPYVTEMAISAAHQILGRPTP